MGSKSSRSVELFLKFVGEEVLVENQIELNSYNSGLLNSFIIKFRYNARDNWLKQRPLSEYRCTEQRCHAISPFVKCLVFFLGFLYIYVFIYL